MTGRLDTPNTEADIQIRDLLGNVDRAGFVVVAGAGSGKTTSLVKALAHVTQAHGDKLRARTQQVACITYTEVAAAEIHADVGNDPLVHVSTIHSFLWQIIRPFQRDIGSWVRARILSKIAALDSPEATSTAARRARADTDRIRYERQRSAVETVHRFTYGISGDYGRGQLGHSDILAMVPELITTRPLMAQVVAAKYPFVFVDESQDTTAAVVEAIKHIHRQAAGPFCVGFFGDPMQQIYPTGIGIIEPELGWQVIDKPENFRSARNVLAVINQVRSAADGASQTPGRGPDHTPNGEVFTFVIPADARRTVNLERVQRWLDAHSLSNAWTSGPSGGTKILVAMHKLAARRLGFEDLHAAFHPSKPGSLGSSFDDGNAWPITPFTSVILPLCDEHIDGIKTIAILRRRGNALGDTNLTWATAKKSLLSAAAGLKTLRDVVNAAGPGSIERALRIAVDTGLIEPDPRLSAYLDPTGPHGDQVLSEKTTEILGAYMRCDVAELPGYLAYVNRESPYSTQHSTKGTESPRVIVILDDHDDQQPAYSYEKLLGLKELSIKDRQNEVDGLDTTIHRTRRLLYVCVSRAQESLAVVLYADDTVAAVAAMRESGLPGSGEPITLDQIDCFERSQDVISAQR